ncbi:MAG: membrane protein insertion efficiency factor YidD [Candidatus Acidiferrales bacterium]
MHDQNSVRSTPNGAPAQQQDLSIPAPRPRSPDSWVLLLLVRMYIIFLSPFFGGACKFYPSCSNYAREAIERHGARRGTLLALKRLLRCHPFTRGGIDFVPDEFPGAHRAHAQLNPGGQGKAQ